jgi:hypothetical protein
VSVISEQEKVAKRLKIPKGEIEEQTKQWLKEKVQKDKQRSIKHTHKTKDQIKLHEPH